MATKDSPCFHFLISVCAEQVQSNSSLLRFACKAGNVSALRMLCEKGCPLPVDIVHHAALGGCLSCLMYLQNELLGAFDYGGGSRRGQGAIGQALTRAGLSLERVGNYVRAVPQPARNPRFSAQAAWRTEKLEI